MTYDAATSTVIWRSKMPLRIGLKRNFQVMPRAEWLLYGTLSGNLVADRCKNFWRD